MFPSSRAAVEYGNAKGVKAPQSDIVFNSPIVLYTHKAVADGLVNGGLVTKDDSGAYHMDMAKAVDAMVANTTWADVGYTAGYGQFRIDSTDPVKSNSGNEYAALLATVLNGVFHERIEYPSISPAAAARLAAHQPKGEEGREEMRRWLEEKI